ncbi:MAG TPA: AI-2E family transporter [Patescibacteria group bacterium]|nr:AI-2E family transporter [Patescibacteria group bacterium]
MARLFSTDPPVRISITTGTILRTIGVLIAVGVIWLIRDIVLYIFTAMLVAGLLYPLARWARAHRIPRGLAVLFAYVVLFGLFVLVFALLIPAVLDQVRMLANAQGGTWQWFSQAADAVRTFLGKYGFTTSLQTGVSSLQSQAQATVSNLFGFLVQIFGGIAGLLIVLVLSFYMIVEDTAIRDMFRSIVPQEYQELVVQVVWQMVDKLGGWLRGELVLSAIIGLMYFIGLEIIGVPYALLLALLGGLTEFIPYIGPFISAIPIVIFAFADSPWRALAAAILVIIIHELESNVLVPKVMQKAVGLNPVVSIVAFLIGAELFGVVGAIFAIPIATAISVAISEVLRFRRDRAR